MHTWPGSCGAEQGLSVWFPGCEAGAAFVLHVVGVCLGVFLASAQQTLMASPSTPAKVSTTDQWVGDEGDLSEEQP